MAGTFNQSLQCTQDVFVGFQAPSPPVTDGLAHIGDVQCFDCFLLAKKLSEPIEGTRELGHDQHRLEVIRYFKPRRVASGEVGRHFVNGDGGVFLVGDLDVHG